MWIYFLLLAECLFLVIFFIIYSIFRRMKDAPQKRSSDLKGEGGDEGSPEEGDKLEGDDESGSISPVSAVSPSAQEEEGASPNPDLPSPTSPRSINDEGPIREMTPYRCTSKESAESLNRSPSRESMLSERANLLHRASMPPSALSPLGVTLPPTLPVAAAAALLPPQSAAMAAYLNAAAAAAVAQQSHRLMMTSPLPPAFNRSSISPLVTSSSSPPGAFNSSISPCERNVQSPPDDGILDFSRKSKHSDVESDTDALNFSKPESPAPEAGNGPLDLSCYARKRSSDETSSQPPARKPKTEYKSPIPQWPPSLGTSHLPYFAAAVAAASNLSPKSPAPPSDLWNGKMKHSGPAPSDATKALEKMSELSKLGGEDLFRTMANQPSQNSASNRHSAWQSHWLNKGAEQAKDVLKCVWCKQSFPSLAAMTTHMKEAKHCGVNVPVPPMQSQNLIPQPQMTPPNTNSSSSAGSSNKPMSSDLNMLIKETMPLPRKLVRGQDVWLGRGAEQTRQILKCMWCGRSFRSLAEMTSHMQQTQHYTNIVSQEQIISWRSSDDSKGGGGGGGPGGNPPPSGASSHVSAVLTCKVCDQAFSSLKELSNHMVKNSHYKEHIMRSITESGGRRRQTREKRKKSLPVRKLLELERAQHDFKNGDNGLLDKMRETTSAGRITCEKCGLKIETSLFVDHIRQCIGGGSIGSHQRNFLKSALISNSILPPESPTRDKIKSEDKSPSPVSQNRSSSADLSGKETPQGTENNNGSSPSVLNAIEKLIEKSFDSRQRQNAGYPGHGNVNAPMGSSILKRLGIDESVDYTKPLVDAQTMNLLRSYHQQQQNHYARRERSGSESSSISERGSSRIDALTPERKMDPPGVPLNSSTPRSTPDKREKSPYNEKNECHSDTEMKVKKEVDGDECPRVEEQNPEVVVKKECTDDEDERQSYHSSGMRNEDEDKVPSSPKQSMTPAENVQPNSPCRNSTSSPASSDRSGTPRSTNGDKKPGGSLGALSSMFDNLSGTSNENPAPSTGKKGSSHPLAALQKLCDKTETHTNTRPHSSSSQPVPNPNPTTVSTSGTTPGAILAFSWACNDAVMTSDSIMKCAFCDTPFISKGAYRHHLSKMHFVKDGIIPDPVALKSNQPSSSSSGVPLKGTQMPNVPGSSSSSKSPPVPSGFEESPHSKFLKYTELAKQLSSKYV